MDRFFEDGALFGNRLLTQVVTVIGLFGLLLSVGGLYGVVAYSVAGGRERSGYGSRWEWIRLCMLAFLFC